MFVFYGFCGVFFWKLIAEGVWGGIIGFGFGWFEDLLCGL